MGKGDFAFSCRGGDAGLVADVQYENTVCGVRFVSVSRQFGDGTADAVKM